MDDIGWLPLHVQNEIYFHYVHRKVSFDVKKILEIGSFWFPRNDQWDADLILQWQFTEKGDDFMLKNESINCI